MSACYQQWSYKSRSPTQGVFHYCWVDMGASLYHVASTHTVGHGCLMTGQGGWNYLLFTLPSLVTYQWDVGHTLLLHKGGSLGCPLSLAEVGGVGPQLYLWCLLEEKWLIHSWLLSSLVLWLERIGFCWGLFCVHLLAFLGSCLLQQHIWCIGGKNKTLRTSLHVFPQVPSSPASLLSFYHQSQCFLLCIMFWFLAVLNEKSRGAEVLTPLLRK